MAKKTAIIVLLLFAFTVISFELVRRTMITYIPVKSSVVYLDEIQRKIVSKELEKRSNEFIGSIFKEKSNAGYQGELENSELYIFNYFGYCSYTECITLSNDFSKNEYRILYYKNRMLPFSDKKSALQFVNHLVSLGSEVPELQ